MKFIHGHLKECQKKVLEIHLHQTIVLIPKWIDGYKLPKIKFNENYLKQDIVNFLHKNVVNLYITYKLDAW